MKSEHKFRDLREFGHKRPGRRDDAGQITELIEAPVKAITREAMDGSFLRDRGRKLVVSLEAGDLIVIRPAGTPRKFSASAFDVFRWLVKCEANRVALERARERKSKLAERRAAARMATAERRFKEKNRRDREREAK